MLTTHTHAVSGEHVPALEVFDALMARCLAEHGVPGAALAVARHGRLVYARGFGWADLQSLEPMQPGSRFRLASVSKPLTAVAVLRLVQAGRLSLDDRAFEVLPVTPHLAPGARPDPRLARITLRHLLHHTAGWDRDRSGDPMFMALDIARALGVDAPAEPEHIIRWVSGRPLDTDPGQAYAYSNFGYCLLGRIIERVSGQPYGEYVRQLLAPLAIPSLALGRTLFAGRLPGEGAYYPLTDYAPSVFEANLNQRVPENYGGWYVEAMDAHGGWVGSAPDLLKFAGALDATGDQALLSPASVQALFSPPPPPVGLDAAGQPRTSFYACGWAVDLPVNGSVGQQHHNGMLPGSASVLRRRDDGTTWAALFNRALGRQGQYLGAAVVALMGEALKEIKDWPGS
jgi:N-acyl-D-amino-acid deacylase